MLLSLANDDSPLSLEVKSNFSGKGSWRHIVSAAEG